MCISPIPVENSSLVKVMYSWHSLSYEFPNFYLAKFSSVADVIHEITSCRKLCHQVISECNSTNTINKSQCASTIFFTVDWNSLPCPQSFWSAPGNDTSGWSQFLSMLRALILQFSGYQIWTASALIVDFREWLCRVATFRYMVLTKTVAAFGDKNLSILQIVTYNKNHLINR